jgi:hypothetical protein
MDKLVVRNLGMALSAAHFAQINGVVGFNFAPIKVGLTMRFSTAPTLIQVLGIHTKFGLIPIRKSKSFLLQMSKTRTLVYPIKTNFKLLENFETAQQ